MNRTSKTILEWHLCHLLHEQGHSVLSLVNAGMGMYTISVCNQAN